MSAAVAVLVPGLRLVSEANERGAWHRGARRAADQRRIVKLTLRTRRPPPLPCTVTITRVAPCALDDDNLARSAKAVRDEVAAWLGVDDRDPRVTWRVVQSKGKPREYAVRIAVRPWSTRVVGARVTSSATLTHLEAVLTAEQRVALGQKLLAHAEVSMTIPDAGLRVTFFTLLGAP